MCSQGCHITYYYMNQVQLQKTADHRHGRIAGSVVGRTMILQFCRKSWQSLAKPCSVVSVAGGKFLMALQL